MVQQGKRSDKWLSLFSVRLNGIHPGSNRRRQIGDTDNDYTLC